MMTSREMSDEEIARRGLEIYEQRLKPLLEPHRNGAEVAIHIEDGDYEVADTFGEAGIRLRERHPEAEFLLLTVGEVCPVHWSMRYYEVPSGTIPRREFISSGDPEADAHVLKGLEIYEQELKPILEPGQNGRFIVLNVDNGDYAVADTSMEADALMRAQYPDQVLYAARIGYDLIANAPVPQVLDAARKP